MQYHTSVTLFSIEYNNEIYDAQHVPSHPATPQHGQVVIIYYYALHQFIFLLFP